MKMSMIRLYLVTAFQLLASGYAFSIPSSRTASIGVNHIFSKNQHTKSASSSCSNAFANKIYYEDSGTALYAAPTTTTTSVFDFTMNNATIKEKSVNSFERIDDAIMGGISLSALRDVPEKNYASWSGVCRTDGGGFCGMRTLPFKTSPLNATNQDGIFIDCFLTSDDEPEKRIWKMTVRTDSSRGEMVYQAQFDLKAAMDKAKSDNSEQSNGDGHPWARVMVPFDEFQLVRGPRLVPDGPKLDVSGGIFQIGMTLSKFQIAVNTTQLEDFRAGYFDMHIQRIGFYKNDSDSGDAASLLEKVPDTLTKKEAESKRPLILKMLLPVAKLLFSEKANRRKSCMNILREKRGLTRPKAIIFGIKIRSKTMGLIPSIAKTCGIIGIDAFRTVLKTVLKIVFVYPLRLIGGMVRSIKKMFGMKVKPSLTE